jgi:hypothetical protein
MNLRAILKKRAEMSQRAADRLSNLRGLVFIGAALFLIALAGRLWALVPALVGVALFAWLVLLHEEADRVRRKYLYRLRLLDQDEARKRLEWKHLPELVQPAGSADAVASYFVDVDVVGEASLLRLVNQTVSQAGLTQLLEFFNSGPLSDSEILERQRVVRELEKLPILRMRFRLAAGTESPTDARELLRLASEPAHSAGAARWVWGLGSLQFVAHVLLVLWLIRGGTPWFLAGWGAAFLTFRAAEGVFHEPFERALALQSELERFERLISVLERHRHGLEPGLCKLLEPFHGEMRPSQLLGQLGRWVSLLSVKGNPGVHFLLNLALPWDFFATLRLERTRLALSVGLPGWIATTARFEALMSLAAFSEACPESVSPVLISSQDSSATAAYIQARALGHPLIPRQKRVCSDLVLTPDRPCLLITGSNMSGKSTFLRTLGINVLLARAGARVVATEMRFSNLDVRASLRTHDSLRDEVSTFYAEVKRLKEVLEAAKSSGVDGSTHRPPVLYLIDEIFQGTNNRERLIGSRAYIEALLKTNSCGLIATHDLELAELEQRHPELHNVHFRETIEEGQMRFSYELKPGPCPSTNALKIMALAGLPVP